MFVIAGVLPAIPAEAADAFPGNGSITLGADANGATATGNDTYTYTDRRLSRQLRSRLMEKL